jgi:uncharacterized protein YecE (DUF72 family)
MDLRVGCCGFPEARNRYYREFSIVEVQQTFYSPPEVSTLKRWREEAPEGFEFTVKAWQIVTHPSSSPTYRRLKKRIGNPENYGFFRPTKEVMDAWKVTSTAAEALKARVILFQTPRSFKPEKENINNLYEFLHRIKESGFIIAFEPRGWDKESILKVCKEFNLVHVVDPFVDEILYGDILYWRLHGIGGYRYRYTDKDLSELKNRLVSTSKKGYILFNNISMLEDARRFREFLLTC